MENNMDEILDEIVENLCSTLPIIRKKLLKFDCGALGVDISHHHFLIMKALSESEPLPVSAIGRYSGISKPEMTHFTDKLSDIGLVERQPDTSDRRIINLSLTKKGMRILGEVKILMRDSVKSKLSSLETNQLKELADSLDKFAKNILKIEGND